MSTPSVSWLLCTHVANDQLRKALQSCFDQSFTDFECIVVANGEDAKDIAETLYKWFGDDSRLFIYTTAVRHLTFSLALGLHYARAPLVARMDGDDVSSLDRLSRQVAFMNTNPQIGILGSQYNLIDDAGGIIFSPVKLPTSDLDIRLGLLRGNPLCHPSVIFRRHLVVNVGGYLGGVYAQDYDLWARLSIDQSIQFANLSVACLDYRFDGVGTARKARWAYASVAGSQFRNFVLGAGWRWGIAAFATMVKAFLRSTSIKTAGRPPKTMPIEY